MDRIGAKLIEPNVRHYLQTALQSSHEIKTTMYYRVFNATVLLVFLGIFGAALYIAYKRKKTPQEIHEKMLRDQDHILSKIRFYQSERRAVAPSTSSITQLPSINQ